MKGATESVLELVTLDTCTALMLESWNAPPGRFFSAYRTRYGFCALLGHAVVDEFATLSSPIFLGPRAALGKLYNVGLTLGHRRDPEMGLDSGWPPLCVGLELPTPELPRDWEERWLEMLTAPRRSEQGSPPKTAIRGVEVGSWQLELARQAEAAVLGTSAPLLPRQLQRLCDMVDAPVVVAVATGNRIERSAAGAPVAIEALSESRFSEIEAATRDLAR